MRECLASALQQLAIKRVGLYPRLAVNAHIQGVVILGQQIGEDGDVMEVRLLRSANPLLDREAERAVRQWRYSPSFSTEFAFHSSSPSLCRSSWKHRSRKEGPGPRSLSQRKRPRGIASGAALASGGLGSTNRFNPRASGVEPTGIVSRDDSTTAHVFTKLQYPR